MGGTTTYGLIYGHGPPLLDFSVVETLNSVGGSFNLPSHTPHPCYSFEVWGFGELSGREEQGRAPALMYTVLNVVPPIF